MNEEVIAGAVLAVPQTEARDVIATCRSAWGTVHASQSEGGEVNESALTIYIASCERLEELGYSVEERSAELEIMQLEGDSPYDGDVMVSPAVFLNLEPRAGSLERTGRGHGRSSRAGTRSVLCVAATQGQRGQPLVEGLWWNGFAFPPGSYLLWTSPAVPSYAYAARRRQAKFPSLRRMLLRAVVNMVWDSSTG